MSHRERPELAEARQQQQRRYERDVSQFKAKEKEREQERRERWLARHRLLGSPGRGSASRLGYRLNGNPRCGVPLGHGAPAQQVPSASASFTSSSALSSSSRCSRGLALVPWGRANNSVVMRPSAESRKHDDALGSPSRPPDRPPEAPDGGADASSAARAAPGQPPAGPDVGAFRLAYKIKQENMEYEKRQRQRLSRFKEKAASARRRIPKNDPGHRLGRADTEGATDHVRGAGAGAALGGGARFHRAGARPTPARAAPRAAPKPPSKANPADANPEPTITLPDEEDAPDPQAYRGSPYILPTSRAPSYTNPYSTPMRFAALPRAARSPTVARNTPAASTTSTPKASPSPPRAVPTRTYPTYRVFAVPRTVTPTHNCGMDHGHPVAAHPAHPAHPIPHRQAPGGRARPARRGFAPARANRVPPSSPGIKLGTGVILPQMQMATIVAVARNAADVAVLPAAAVVPSPKVPAAVAAASPPLPPPRPAVPRASPAPAPPAPPPRPRPPAANARLSRLATAKGPVTARSRAPTPSVPAAAAKRSAAADPAPPLAKVQKTQGRPWR